MSSPKWLPCRVTGGGKQVTRLPSLWFTAGFLQKTALSSLGCIWFNRTEANDRAVVARK